MTHHTCTLPTRVSSRDPSSIRIVVPVHATAWPTNAQDLRLNYPVHAIITHQVYLGKLDSSSWAEEQLGLNMACCKAPSHSEHCPPVEARKHGQYRWRVTKSKASQQTYHARAHVARTLGWPPPGSVLVAHTRVNAACRQSESLALFSHVWSMAGATISNDQRKARPKLCSHVFPSSSSPLHCWQQSPGRLSFNVQPREGQGRGRHSFIPP